MIVITDRELREKNVVTRDGHVIGTVDEVVFEADTWRVLRIGVKVRRDALASLGLKKPWIRSQEIMVPVREIAGVSDEVVLRNEAAELDFVGGEHKN